MQQWVIWVRPADIQGHAMQPFKKYRPLLDACRRLPVRTPYRCLNVVYQWSKKRLIHDGDWDLKCEPIEETEAYRNLLSLYRVLPNFRDSGWYAQALRELEVSGVFSHKYHVATEPADVDRVFQEVLIPLLFSMKAQGYVQHDGDDIPEGMISRHGELIKTEKGRHRLAAARIVGADTLYPLKIVAVHRRWREVESCVPLSASRERLASAIRALGRVPGSS